MSREREGGMRIRFISTFCTLVAVAGESQKIKAGENRGREEEEEE